MIHRRLLFTALAAMLACSPASAKDDYVYGPAPDWARYRQLGEAAVRAALPDQASWEVGWPNGYVKRGWIQHGHVYGYATCGVLHAIKPVTGYDPLTDFVIVIDHDAVKTLDISNRSNGKVAIICRSVVQQGQMPPASMMAAPAPAPTALVVGLLGLEIRAAPEGAYIVSVASGSAAARAGLVPGTVLTRANGISLVGMGAAMATVLGADTPALTLDTATGGHFDIKR
ncbi:hypothetical protein [Sphingomonas bacterium]|uniref:hypothetical protein n=1 Tax=Sphingomonas bacterium TaxID=1895847 RepID=UPI0015762019|nr:hypothetical protein [Sphingomonas bacterium]